MKNHFLKLLIRAMELITFGTFVFGVIFVSWRQALPNLVLFYVFLLFDALLLRGKSGTSLPVKWVLAISVTILVIVLGAMFHP